MKIPTPTRSTTPKISIAERLRAIADAMPEGGAVTLPVRELREWLEAEPAESQPDLTLDDLRARYFQGKSLSTLRSWCARKLFPHAYKPAGGGWMIPRCCIAELRQTTSDGQEKVRTRPKRRRLNTGAWRNH